ncbi:MAG: HNH endonuclease signature motif containing protein, partial [Acidimicrobiales bacterium]
GEARFFTGNSRHAVKLQSTECVWPGCHVPTSMCEADHLHQHSRCGRTHPGNGAPLCGKHNRWKQKGFTIWRDPSGTWHTVRPDGTEI